MEFVNYNGGNRNKGKRHNRRNTKLKFPILRQDFSGTITYRYPPINPRYFRQNYAISRKQRQDQVNYSGDSSSNNSSIISLGGGGRKEKSLSICSQ